MTTRQIIESALTMTTGNSMYELSRAKIELEMVGDYVSALDLQIKYRKAVAHIQTITENQHALAVSGAAVRIF